MAQKHCLSSTSSITAVLLCKQCWKREQHHHSLQRTHTPLYILYISPVLPPAANPAQARWTHCLSSDRRTAGCSPACLGLRNLAYALSSHIYRARERVNDQAERGALLRACSRTASLCDRNCQTTMRACFLTAPMFTSRLMGA